MFGNLIKRFLLKEKEFYHLKVDNLFERDLLRDIKVFQKQHPIDDFGRSIAQHKCQVYPFKKDVFLLNCLSCLVSPFIIVSLLIKKRDTIKDNRAKIVCYNCFNLPGSLPEKLLYKELRFISSKDCPYYLKFKDISFWLSFLIKNVCHPFLSFRVLLKIAKYRFIIDSFQQLESIVITGEYSDTSSAMTKYCHMHGLKHLNFMQGEAFGSPRASFFHFDKCFVWDQHYADLYVSFGACSEQFEVSIPKCLQKIENPITEKTVDYTYYLGGDADEELYVIKDTIDKLVARGYVCEVRPHPKWSDLVEVEKVFQGITIQNTACISVEDSIVKTKNAISLYSTVLLQAFYNDVSIVIDDISCPSKFNMLESYRYIMLNKPHQLLSQLINS